MKGFTFLEIIVAVSIIFILGVLAIAAFSNFSKNSLLQEGRAKVISELNYARSETLASEGKSSWGVHFESSKVVRFKGSLYVSGDPSNVETNLPGGVIIFSNPGDIVFERLTGRVSGPGPVVLRLTSNPSASTTINIYASGIAE